MEVDGEDGSRLFLDQKSTTLFGRGSGFTCDDRTVSRRHVLFDVITPDDEKDSQTEFRVSLEVIGRNPIWLRSGLDGEIRIFRRFSKGEMAPGDSFCVAAKSPMWFNLKKADEFEPKDERISWSKSEIGASLGNGFDFEGVDVLGIDPVKEFGFVVMGHEFDHYTRRIVRDPNKWKWFLEETRENSDQDGDDDDKEVGKRERKGTTQKRKNTAEDDDDWSGDSEDDKEMIAKVRKIGRPKYSTRLNDVRKAGSKSSSQKKTLNLKEEESEADEDDETLGGFIVDEDDVGEEQTNVDREDEEEEEFIDEEDDDE